MKRVLKYIRKYTPALVLSLLLAGLTVLLTLYIPILTGNAVDLIIGMTFGKAFSGEDPWAGSGKDEWKSRKDVLVRCLKATLDLEDCQGVAVFCYQYFFDPLTGQSIAETAEERDHFVPAFQEITWD